MVSRVKAGAAVFDRLIGIACIYKPTGLAANQVVHIIKHNLVRDLNALPSNAHEQLAINRRLQMGQPAPLPTDVPVTMDTIAEHRLVLGDPYTEEDVSLNFMGGLGKHSSGVMLLAVGGRSSELFKYLARARLMRVYHVRGRFGMSTDNFSPKGRIIERTTYHHIQKGQLDKVCSSTQTSHQRMMFQAAGLEPDSQEAYEAAVHGLIRPAVTEKSPILYGVRCVDFKLPDFMLEIQAINEDTRYFMNLVHEMGLGLKSTAVCTHIQRVRYGRFTLQHALLRHNWNLSSILENIRDCKKFIVPKSLVPGELIASDTSKQRQERGADPEEMDTGALLQEMFKTNKSDS